MAKLHRGHHLHSPKLGSQPPSMNGLQDALRWCQAFVSQCKTGKKAELRLLCEDGHLKVNICAELGPCDAPEESSVPSWKVGNSRQRRSVRRAAERTAAGKVTGNAGMSASVEEAAATTTAAEKKAECAEAKKAAERIAAAAESETAVKAADSAALKAAIEQSSVEEAAAKIVVMTGADESGSAEAVASTSCRGSQQLVLMTNCLNCDELMTPDHQCAASTVNSPEGVAEGTKVPLPGLPCVRPGPLSPLVLKKPVPSDAVAVAPPRPKGLNIKKFCVKCEVRHPAGQKCKCQSVKCHVCAVLGRETSLVLCGSRCPSCGVTATAS